MSSSTTESDSSSPTVTRATELDDPVSERERSVKRKTGLGMGVDVQSVRGCIVGNDIRVLSVIIVKQGEKDLAGLTDVTLPKRLGPKRATRIRKFFNLSKEDDVTKFG